MRHLQLTDVPVPAGVPKHDRQLFVSKAFFSTACALILELPFTLHHKNTQISRYLTVMPSPALPPSTIITLNKSLNSKPSMTVKCKQFKKKKISFASFVLSNRLVWLSGFISEPEILHSYRTIHFIQINKLIYIMQMPWCTDNHKICKVPLHYHHITINIII